MRLSRNGVPAPPDANEIRPVRLVVLSDQVVVSGSGDSGGSETAAA